MSYNFNTEQGAGAILRLVSRGYVYDEYRAYFTTHEFNPVKAETPLLDVPATRAGNELVITLTPEQVDQIGNGYYHIRGSNADEQNVFVDSGKITYRERPSEVKVEDGKLYVVDKWGREFEAGYVQGPPGPQGPAGTQGATGPAGIKGDPGNGYTPEQVALIQSATPNATGSTLVLRGPYGHAEFAGVSTSQMPVDDWNLTRKDYVDNKVANVLGDQLDVTTRNVNGTEEPILANTNSGGVLLGNGDGFIRIIPFGDGYTYVQGNQGKLRFSGIGGTSGTDLSFSYNATAFTGTVVIGAQGTSSDSATRKDYVDNKVASAGTVEVDANSVVRRDQNGGTKLNWLAINGTPNNVFDVTNKQYVDTAVAPVVAATDLNTVNTIVKRDASGNINLGRVFVSAATPSANAELTRKDYVDGIGNAAVINNSIVRRSGAGNSSFNSVMLTNAPGAADHATRKDYVDAGDLFDTPWAIGGAEPFTRPNNPVVANTDFAVFACFTAKANNTISKFLFPVNAAGAGITLFRVALFSINDTTNVYTLLARSDNDLTAATTTGLKTLPFSTVGGYPANYTFVRGQRYAFGFRVQATTAPSYVARFVFEAADVKPWVATQLYFGANANEFGPTLTASGSWWNAPYIAGAV